MTKQKDFLILTINPGSTSTKIGVFKNEKPIFITTVRHNVRDLERYANVWDQYVFRKDEITQALEANNIKYKDLDAVVGRGGLIKPIPSGVYAVDEEMIKDAREGYQGHHAANLGCVIAYSIGWEFNIPSFIVDPPAVDDFEPLARVSGFAKIERKSLLHALNVFATSRLFAEKTGRKFEDLNLIVAHLGGGITVSAIKNGKAINANNGIDEGPFTPERSGSLPLRQFLDLCTSGEYTKDEIKKIIAGKGGLVSYFNTNKANEVEEMVLAGSEKYKLVYEAMAYQIAEEIGKRATNLKGKVDAIIITGGIAHSDLLCNWIEERVSFIAPVHRFPGEKELEALALGALRVLRGEETVKRYADDIQRVGIYYLDSLEVYVSAINHIEDRFREKGFVFRKENSNLDIIYANCKGEDEKDCHAIENLLANDVDVVFALGSPASIRALQHLKNTDVPVVCTGIYDTNALASIKWKKRPDFYASLYGIKVKEQIENTIMKINPDIKKLGFLYKIGELQSHLQQDEVKEYCKSKGIDLVQYDVQDPDDLDDAAKYFIDQNADWVFVSSNSVTAAATVKQLKYLTDNIPTLCVIENTIVNGGLIGYLTPWAEVCKSAADFAINLLNGLDIKENIVRPKIKQIVVNNETAKKLGLDKQIKKIQKIKYLN